MTSKVSKQVITQACHGTPQLQNARHFSGLNLHTIRKNLATFEGGSVDLDMDDSTGIAVVTLNNPRRLNAMTGKMMVDMADCVSELEQWKEGKGIVLCGAGGNLCSGGDLTFVRRALHYGSEMAAYQHDTLTRLLNLPMISVALVQGHTLGGGAELTTACDYRVMSSQAKIGFVQIKMGLATAWGATTRLTGLLGRRKAIDLLCSAKILSPGEAQELGLVDYVIPRICHDETREAQKWLQENFCKFDTNVMRTMKSLVVNADVNVDLTTALDNERKLFAPTWGGAVQRRALAANIKHR